MEEVTITAARETPMLESRGYSFVYRENEVNHCPGCGRTHWYIGRVSAQCGFCETAVPLASSAGRGAGTHHSGRRVIGEFDPASL